MGVTLRNIAERIVLLYAKAKNSDDSYTELDIREVIPYIQAEAVAIMRQKWFEYKTVNDKLTDAHFLYTYEDNEILVDARTRNYIELPATYATLPRDRGVHEIKPVSKKAHLSQALIPIPKGADSIFYRLKKNGNLNGKWAFSLVGQRVYFLDNGFKTLIEAGITTVDVTLVIVSPEDQSIDDGFNLPQEFHNMVIERVFALFAAARGAKLAVKDYIEVQEETTTQ